MIYRAMIRSILDYGCVFFGAAKSVLFKLDRVQAKALRICCGAFKTTPIPALLIELGGLPLGLRRDKLGMHCFIKLCGAGLGSVSDCVLASSWEFSII